LSGVTEIHDGVAVEVEVAVLALKLVEDILLEIGFALDYGKFSIRVIEMELRLSYTKRAVRHMLYKA
jgi:hypothetical protein